MSKWNKYLTNDLNQSLSIMENSLFSKLSNISKNSLLKLYILIDSDYLSLKEIRHTFITFSSFITNISFIFSG